MKSARKHQNWIYSLTKQQVIFCHKLALIHDLSKTSDSLVNQLSDLRTFYEDIDEKISEYIDWQDSAQGRSSDLPRIEESQKDIILVTGISK
jgi:hypothetical protein